MLRNSNALLPPTVFVCRLGYSGFAAAYRLKGYLFAHCSVIWKHLATALGYACASKFPVDFRNLQLVHDSCFTAKFILRLNVRGGHFVLYHFDLPALLTCRYTVRISSLLRLGFRFFNFSVMWVLSSRTHKTKGKTIYVVWCFAAYSLCI